MKISGQQKVILEHLSNGKKGTDIPDLMDLCQSGVDLYIRAAKKNLKATTTMHAVAIAIREGLIE